MNINIEELLSLPKNERLEIVSTLIESIEDDDLSENFSEEENKILNERIKKFEANTEGGISWEDLKAKYIKKQMIPKK